MQPQYSCITRAGVGDPVGLPCRSVIRVRTTAWPDAQPERHNAPQLGKGRRTDVKVGDKAPDFEALDQHGNTLVLRDLLDSGPVVVYFYAKAMTRG